MSAFDPSEWIRYATDDLAAGRLLLGTATAPRIAAYHAQQAAEKALKAVLVAEGTVVPKIHDLLAIRSKVQRPLDGLPETAALARMTAYAMKERYPDDLPDIGEEEARDAVETADAVLAAVRATLGV